MGRSEIRDSRSIEVSAIHALEDIRKKFVPSLFKQFSEVADPRDTRYITYSGKTMLSQIYFKNLLGIISMQGMTDYFNDKVVSGNVYSLIAEQPSDYLPHHVTENEYLERLDPDELRKIIYTIDYSLIRRKTFDDAKYFKKWLVLIDATQTYSGGRQINGNCLERHYKNDDGKETINYHTDILEAKLYLGNGRVVSLASEFIENSPDDKKRHLHMSQDKIKQDCELKAFKRLAEKLKKRYPRLPIILVADSLYAAENVMETCRNNRWDYIIRYKDGSIPSIAEEYESIPEKNKVGQAEYINEIDYRGHKVNMLRYHDDRKEKGIIVHREFQWLTSITITDKNAEKIAGAGRIRWKIENQGFNRQKHWSADITHACSHNANALKNHYLIMQIADLVRQLYEWFYLEKKGIRKTYKKISSDLQFALSKQFVRLEDTQHAGADKAFC